MGALQLLSALNWCCALALALVSVGFAVISSAPASVGAVVIVAALVAAAPFAWLGAVVEKGRGRGLQTAMAVISLLGFPVGTAFGAFALWVCWFSDSRELFEQGPVPAGRAPGPTRRAPARRTAEEEDDVTVPNAAPGETPFAYAQRLKRAGFATGAIRQRLTQRGLEREEIETLLAAVGRTGARR